MKDLSLSIAKPCSEKWQNFTRTGDGGFCSSCRKTVVDFTGMSDHQILDFFTQEQRHTCGRFRSDQLKAYTADAPLKVTPGLTLLKAGFLSMLFVIAGKQTFAQESPKVGREVVERKKHRQIETADENKPRKISGIILAENESPLPGANIVLKGSTIGTNADADGRFEFPEKLKEGDVLVITFIGFNPLEYVVPASLNEAEIEVELMCDFSVMGEVAVDRIYQDDTSGLRKIWTKVKGLF